MATEVGTGDLWSMQTEQMDSSRLVILAAHPRELIGYTVGVLTFRALVQGRPVVVRQCRNFLTRFIVRRRLNRNSDSGEQESLPGNGVSAKRDDIHPTATVMCYAYYHLFRKLFCTPMQLHACAT